MKALKQAEENQQSLPSEREPTLGELAQELSLEPAEQAPQAAASAEKSASASPDISAQAQAAANLFQAKQGGESGGSKRSTLWLAGAGMLILLGGGTYVYLAINHPAMLQFSSARKPVAPPATPVVLQQPVQVPDAGELKAAAAEPVVQPVAPEPYRAPATMQLAAPEEAKAEPRARVQPVAGDEAIRISRGDKVEVNADLDAAYRALQEGRIDVAQTHYQRLLQQEPRNLDALLGMAVVAGRHNKLDEAGRYYFRALEVAPKNPVAQAGMLSLLGMADPAASEARMKQLLAQQPAAFLHFSLGNLLAAQERWNEAQQSYFQAYHMDAENPDYAFNLAVSLEHLNQPKPALTYYRRALQLLQGRSAGFERAAVEARIAHLQGKVD